MSASRLDLDELFDEADAMASEEAPAPPDLPLPLGYDEGTPHRLMEVRGATSNGEKNVHRQQNGRNNNKGRGWYARRRIEAGTVLLVEKPVGMVMRWEEEEAEYGDDDDMSVEGAEQQQIQSSHGATPASDDNDNMESTSRSDDEDEEEGEDEGPMGSVGTALLTMRLAESIKLDPTVWTGALAAATNTVRNTTNGDETKAKSAGICHLYPQTESEIRSLPPWVCSSASVGLAMETALANLCGENAAIDADTAAAIRLRLPLIVRYNALSVETGPELFVHPGPVGHASLSGTALFRQASLFNHSHRPNANRLAIGDVTFFVANGAVEAGTELTISYVEHEILCEPSERRTAVLGMDFVDDDDGCDSENNEKIDGTERMGGANSDGDHDDGGDDEDCAPMMPMIDAEVQQELMEMAPEERLEAIDELLAQAEGKRKAPEDHDEAMGGHDDNEGDDDQHAASWFQCDAHQLRILQALTLDGLGQHDEAYPVWEQCVAFVDARLPPLDETGVALRVQTALCAWAMGAESDARSHARRAMKDHDALFGGGPERFRRRYRRELELNLRPESKKNKKRPLRGLKVMRKLFPIES